MLEIILYISHKCFKIKKYSLFMQINNYSKSQNVRYISDFVEPFIVKQIRKENHSFFAYRASDYHSVEHIIYVHNLVINDQIKEFLEKYWSAIDIILFKIKNMLEYTANKEYFDKLRKLDF